MAKVKPYIITIKYVGFYEDPRPTVDQIANEINIDALEIIIEDAVVTPALKAEPSAATVIEVETRPPEVVVQEPAAAPAVATTETFTKSEAPFDTYDLDRNGPSIKILSTLYKAGKKGRSMKDIRQLTQLSGSAANMAVSRLKRSGRVKVLGKDQEGNSVYGFVK